MAASATQLRTVRCVASLGQRAEEAAPASRVAPLPAGGAAARPARLAASRARTSVAATAATVDRSAYDKFEQLLGKYEFRFRVGDKVTGTVFRVENNGLYVDIGAKSSAFCPVAELTLQKDTKARRPGASWFARVGQISLLRATSA